MAQDAFRTPTGRPTRYQCVNVSTTKGILKGDIVKLGNVQYFVLLGLGLHITNRSVRLANVT